MTTTLARPTAEDLIARAEGLMVEVADRAAALAIARANDQLGNPFRRPDLPDYYPRSIRRYECAERLYNKALVALADAGYVETAHIINSRCAERFKATERRRYAALLKAASRRPDIGFDQAPGLAFTRDGLSCRADGSASSLTAHGVS